ncbi:tetratricopeptide repeat protein [Asanoa iriomotensis]|uniref:ATP/GTP-binding protein n=1 Tax=Asanoa iriomotensis TaxID=234613 RepID=A0ABQ4CG67_9ACTN|nr:tetratricopeptide repeat protein [Asanoa iriomotensis]GIF61451.1 ATP/GTP-binding protein [Asanoa iriomotensis]
MGRASRRARRAELSDVRIGRDNVQIGQARDVTLVTDGPAADRAVEPISIEPPLGLREERYPVRGRDDLVADLTGLFDRSDGRPRIRVLHGLGGCGKTAVALELAHRAQQKGVTVWWVTADPTTLTAGMHAIGRRIGLSNEDLLRPEASDLLWRRLRKHHDRWLLVIDNANDAEVLSTGLGDVAAGQGWLRQHKNHRGLVLVTTQDGNPSTWGSWTHRHLIGVLPPEAGAQVLVDRLPHVAEPTDDAVALAERLGGLPLALKLAGSYLALTNAVHESWSEPDAIRTFDDYRAALDEGRLDLLADETQDDQHTIARTWELSLDLLGRRGMPEARTLLRLLATFADAPIPHELLLQPSTLAQPSLSSLMHEFMGGGRRADLLGKVINPLVRMIDEPIAPAMSGVRLHQVLTALAHLSLVELGSSSPGDAGTVPTLRTHPLVRDVSRRAADLRLRVTALSLLMYAMNENRAGSPQNRQQWAAWYALAPHGAFIYRDIRATPTAGTRMLVRQIAVMAIRVGQATVTFLRASGDYTAAAALQQDVSEGTQVAMLPKRAKLQQRVVLANTIGDAGDPATARDQLAALLPIQERVTGPEHGATLRLRHGLAAWTGEAGDATSARDQYAALLEVESRVRGPEHPDTLISRMNLATWTGKAGDAVSARDQLIALLPVAERVCGAEHPDTLTARANIANWTGAAGDATAAHAQFAALLPVRARVSGPDHPETLTLRLNIATWIGKAGDKAMARDMTAALLPVYERVCGREHPTTLFVRANLANWTGEAGESANARDQFAALLPIRERVSGPDHPETVRVRDGLSHWTKRAPARRS